MSDAWTEVAERMSEFCALADARDVPGLVAMFAADGRLVAGPQTLLGHAQLAAGLEQRLRADRQTVHLWANPRFDAVGPDEMHCRAVQLSVERSEGSERAETRISDLRDRWRRDGDGRWRLHERVLERRMTC